MRHSTLAMLWGAFCIMFGFEMGQIRFSGKEQNKEEKIYPDIVGKTGDDPTADQTLTISSSGDPANPINGDLWYDSSAQELRARINGENVALSIVGWKIRISNDGGITFEKNNVEIK